MGAVLVNFFDHSLLVVELIDGVLQLRIQHPAVRNHNHAAVHLLVLGVMQGRETVRQPSDRVGLARTRRMLHQIGLPYAFGQCGIQQLVHGVPLVIAREQKRGVEHLLALSILVFRHLHGQELSHNGQPCVGMEHLMPQVAGGVAQLVIGRVAFARAPHAVGIATVERQKARGRARQLRCHAYLVGTHREMDQRPLAKR